MVSGTLRACKQSPTVLGSIVRPCFFVNSCVGHADKKPLTSILLFMLSQSKPDPYHQHKTVSGHEGASGGVLLESTQKSGRTSQH